MGQSKDGRASYSWINTTFRRGVGAATIPATDELTAGQPVSVNSKTYTLVKYLGGGTYGKVWSATGPSSAECSIKFVYVDYGDDTPENIQYTKDATLAVINEARITKKLYEATKPHPICSDIHGIGSTTGYMIVVMDIFEITLDWYLEHGGSAKADELVWKLHKMLERVIRKKTSQRRYAQNKASSPCKEYTKGT